MTANDQIAPPVAGDEITAALLETFRSRAEPLGVTVARAADSDAAAAFIARFAVDLAMPEILVAQEIVDRAPALLAALAATDLRWQAPGEPAATRDAPFGVSLARLAVAETGSVLLAEPTLADRAIGMLVATHLVLCPTGELVPSLDEAAPVLDVIARQPGGGYATLVTGPSRTADIERVLTVGVQGPGRLIVLFVDDLGSS